MAQLVGQSHREPGRVGTALNFFFSQGLPGPTGPVGLPGPPGSSGLVVSESLLAPAGTPRPCPLSPVFSCVSLTFNFCPSGSSGGTRFAWTSGEF